MIPIPRSCHSLSTEATGNARALNTALGSGEATALLAVLELSANTRADGTAVESSAASRSAVGVAEASSGNELRARAVSEVLGTGGITNGGVETSGSGRRSRRSSSVVGITGRGGRGGRRGTAAGAEAAALLAVLELSTDARADGTTVESSTASRSTVSVAKTGTGDELLARTVAEVLGTIGITDGSVEASRGRSSRGSSWGSRAGVATAGLRRSSTTITKTTTRFPSLELGTNTLECKVSPGLVEESVDKLTEQTPPPVMKAQQVEAQSLLDRHSPPIWSRSQSC